MRKFTLALVAAVATVGLTGCESSTAALAPAPRYAAVQAPAAPAAPCYQPQAPAAAAPCYQPPAAYVAAQPVPMAVAAPIGVETSIGAPEVARSMLAIPGDAVICTGTYLRCLLDSFWPKPQPTARYVYAPPAGYAPAAGPCR